MASVEDCTRDGNAHYEGGSASLKGDCIRSTLMICVDGTELGGVPKTETNWCVVQKELHDTLDWK